MTSHRFRSALQTIDHRIKKVLLFDLHFHGVFLSGHDLIFVHNTVIGNTNGVGVGASVSGIVLQNNIIMNNTQYGLASDGSQLITNDHNTYFGNQTDCNGCSTLGDNSLTVDPMILDIAGHDFRLDPDSLLINAGASTGYDVNAPVSGNGLYNGAAPDIGAREGW